MVLTIVKDTLSSASFDLHSAAMDAANDPNPETIKAVHKAYAEFKKAVRAWGEERTAELMRQHRMDRE